MNLLLGLFDILIADQVVSKEFSFIDSNLYSCGNNFQNIVTRFEKNLHEDINV